MRYLFMLGILIFSISCKKGPPPEPLRGPFYFTQEFKDYNVFQNGSQWIYQRENTQVKDTIKQEYLNIEMFNGSNSCYCNIEIYLSREKSSFFNDVIIKRGQAKEDTNAIQNQYKPFYDFVSFSYETKIVGNITLTYFNAKNIGDFVYSHGDEKVAYKAFYPTYTLEGKEYKDVKVFEGNLMWSDVRLPRKTYYAKNIGIIRRELWNGQVWNLISYDVKQ